MISAYTRTEAMELLTLYKTAEAEIVGGQAKHYKVGTREFTAVDLPWIQQRIRELAKLIAALDGAARTKRAVQVIHRDL